MHSEDRYETRCNQIAADVEAVLGRRVTRFRAMCAEHGAVQATKRLIHAPRPSETFSGSILDEQPLLRARPERQRLARAAAWTPASSSTSVAAHLWTRRHPPQPRQAFRGQTAVAGDGNGGPDPRGLARGARPRNDDERPNRGRGGRDPAPVPGPRRRPEPGLCTVCPPSPQRRNRAQHSRRVAAEAAVAPQSPPRRDSSCLRSPNGHCSSHQMVPPPSRRNSRCSSSGQ